MHTCVHDNYLSEQKLIIHRSPLPALNCDICIFIYIAFLVCILNENGYSF